MQPAPNPYPPRLTAAEWARLERALKRQEIAEEAAHVGTFEADLATGELTISREVARLHGWDPLRLSLSGTEFLMSVHADDRGVIMGLVGSRDEFTVDYRFLCPDGVSTRIFEISGRWLEADNGGQRRHPGYFIGVERDVTDQRAQEAQLRQLALYDSMTGALNRRGFENLLTRYAVKHAVPDAGCLLMIDLDDFKHHNDTYGHAAGDALLAAIARAVQDRLGPDDAIGRIGGDEFGVLLPARSTPAGLAVAEDLLRTIAEAAEVVSPDPEHPLTASIGLAAFTDDADPTLVLRRADQAMYAAKRTGGARVVRWAKHPQTGGAPTFGALTDVDAAAGLPARRGLLIQMERRLDEIGDGEQTGQIAAYIVELCGIELLEEEPGLAARDLLIRTLTERFREQGGPEVPIGILGDGRLAAMIPVADGVEREAIAERVQSWLEDPCLRGTSAGAMVVPLIGVATWIPGTAAYTLLQNAAIALTKARLGGPGTTCHYEESLRTLATKRAAKHVALRRAVDRAEFQLLYQPGLHLATGRFTRAEALVRWHPATGAMVAPDLFIPLAESTGLIVPLGERVVDLAIAQAQVWRDQLPDLLISVNVSAVELTVPHFADRLIERIERSGLGPKQFTFEVTESALMENLALGQRSLLRLAEAGYRVVIDDFGTGHSSLARLSDIPARGIKVDMGLTRRLSTDAAARKVLRAIVDVGRAYEVAVTAEGIEDAATMQIVRDLGVDYAQGYYLSRPKPAGELTTMLGRTWVPDVTPRDQAGLR